MANENPKYNSLYTGQQVDDSVGRSQNALTQNNIVQNKGYATDKVMSQAAVTKALNNQATTDNINNAIESHNVSNTAHQDIRNLVALKPNASNTYNESQTNTYSSNYINKNFAPVTYVNNLYASKTGTTTAELVADIPQPNANNILTSQTTNTDYDWSNPDFTLTRSLGVSTTLTENNSFEVNLKFMIDRDATLSFGAKIKVSTDNGTTWNYISSNQTTTSQYWATGVGNTIDFVVYTDLLTQPTTYNLNTLIAIEIYKKQVDSTTLTTTVYCGVLVDNANIYTYVKFNFTNVNIDTNQIQNGAVTYSKLSSELQGQIDRISEITHKIETHSVDYSDWYTLSDKSPYTYYTTVILDTLLYNSTMVGLINDNLMPFSQYAFGIYEINGQVATIYSIGQPENTINLSFEIYETDVAQSIQLYAPSLTIISNELQITGNAGNPQGVNYDVYYEGVDEHGNTVPLTLLLTTTSSYIDLTQFIFTYGSYYISAKTSFNGNTSDFSGSVYWYYGGQPQMSPELRSAPQYLFSFNGDSGEYEATINNETYTFTDVSRVVDENDNVYALDRETAEFEIGGTTYLVDYSKTYLSDGQVPAIIIMPDSNNQFILNGVTYTLDSSSYPYSITYEDGGTTYIIPYENGVFEIDGTNYYMNWSAVTDGTNYYAISYTENGITFEMNNTEYIIQQGVGLIDSQNNLYYSGGGDFDINGNYYTLEYDTRFGYETPFSLRDSAFTTTSWSDLENDGIVSINNGALSIDNTQFDSDYFYELIIPDTVTEIPSYSFDECLIEHLFFLGDIQDEDIGTDPFDNSLVLLAMVNYAGMSRTIFPVYTPPEPPTPEDPTMTVVFNVINPELADNFTIDLQPDDKIVGGMGGSLSETMEILSDGTTYYWTATTNAVGYSTRTGSFSTDPDPEEGTAGSTIQIYIDFSDEE